MKQYIFPQYVFSIELKKRLKLITKKSNRKIADCPCGSGITTYNLAKWFPEDAFFGVDLDSESIEFGKKNFQLSNLKFFEEDIFRFFNKSSDFDIICLINSLFLFKNPDNLLRSLKNKLNPNSRLFIIIPNVEGKNFKIFQKQFPDINQFTIHPTEINNFFAPYEFKVISKTPICFVHHFQRIETRFLGGFINFYLIFLERIYKIFSSKSSNYLLIELGC